MPETRERDMRPVQVALVCDGSGSGPYVAKHGCGNQMKATGQARSAWSSHPETFEHTCQGCGAELWLEEKYPRIEFVPVHHDDDEYFWGRD